MHLKVGFVMLAVAAALAGAITAVVWTDEPAESASVKSAERGPTEPLKRSDPGIEPWKEGTVALASGETETGEPKAEEPKTGPKTGPERDPEPQPVEPPPEPSSGPPPAPVMEDDPPEPTEEQIASAYEPRDYDLPDGAVLGLTVKAIGLRNVPVFDSVKERALAKGVGHHPETSMPWSNSPQRNVYLAGHRLGFPGTYSHLVFYRLDELGRGDEILLKNRDGKKYRYRVSEAFTTGPKDSWVTAKVPGRDMVTLQTCTGSNWQRRLIVRADRL